MSGAHNRQEAMTMKLGRAGFTLTEVLVAVTIVGILSAAAVANYGAAVGRARFDAARDVLLKIYDGEWKYNNTVANGLNFYPNPAATLSLNCTPGGTWVACNNPTRNNLFMDAPSTPSSAVSYQVQSVPGGFTATATYVGTGATQTIDQDKQFCGGGACTWVRP